MPKPFYRAVLPLRPSACIRSSRALWPASAGTGHSESVSLELHFTVILGRPSPFSSLDPLFFVSYNPSWLIPSFEWHTFSSSFPKKRVWEKSLRPCLKMFLFYSCNWSVVCWDLEFLIGNCFLRILKSLYLSNLKGCWWHSDFCCFVYDFFPLWKL